MGITVCTVWYRWEYEAAFWIDRQHIGLMFSCNWLLEEIKEVAGGKEVASNQHRSEYVIDFKWLRVLVLLTP